MPTDKPPRPDLLGPEVHTSTVWIMAAVLAGVWILSHFLSSRLLKNPPLKLAGFAVRVAVASGALWSFWQAVARHLMLETSWPLWVNALIGGFSIEVIVALYQLEKRIVRPGIGKWLLALRLVLAGAVLVMLVQPVFSRVETERLDRNVVVLVDDSASMQIADKDMPVAEKLALAASEGIDVVNERPLLPRLMSGAVDLVTALERMAELFKLPDNYSRSETKEFIAGQKAAIDKLEKDAAEFSEKLSQAMDENRPEQRDLPEDIRALRGEVRRRAINDFRERMKDFRNGLSRNEDREIRAAAREAAQLLQRTIDLAGPYSDAVDQKFYDALPVEARKRIDAAAARPRAEIAQQILTRKQNGQDSLVEQIGKKYTLRYVRFGKKAVETERVDGPAGDESFRSRTDLSAALRRVRDSYDGQRLAGVVVVSDFRHNGPGSPDNEANDIGVRGAPICAVLAGSSRGTKDAAIISVGSPQSVFLGDRMRVRTEIKADGMRGRKLAVKLLQNGAVLQEEKLDVPDNDFRTTLRFSHQPPERGIFGYTVRIDPVEGELFPNNNEWNFDVAVSDDRTNVLLLDDRPRWEFRYLRNLFDSRDKSVHLQYVLLHPDTLHGAPSPPDVPASASRKFGESEATRMPATPEEWRKFDVIILGDLPPAALGEDTWKILQECVEERGAMLVIVSGPAHMPHGFNNATARRLIPVDYDTDTKEFLEGPEREFRMVLTAEGRNSPIFKQSDSGVENARIWDEIPIMRWRHSIKGIRSGAEVLAWARETVNKSGSPVSESPSKAGNSDDRAKALTLQRKTEQENALVVAAQSGLGKVAMLMTDQTWRFRYGIGDTVHHKFWGQLLRWGAGENLAAGSEHVRLGTRRLNYEPGEKVRVMARLVDEKFRPVTDADVGIAVYNKDGVAVLKQTLAYQAASHGMYEAEFDSLTDPGAYRIELTGARVEELLAKDNLRTVEQKLTIAAETNPVELGEVSVNPELAARLASLSHGIVARPDEASRMLDLFGEATKEIETRRETKLWDNWIILAIAVAAATAEWILRRKGGLV